MDTKKMFILSLAMAIVSLAIVAYYFHLSFQRERAFLDSFEALVKNGDVINKPGEGVAPVILDIDDRIRTAQIGIQMASNRVRQLKSDIFIHANNAAQISRANQSMLEAQQLLVDISENSKLVAKSHDELEVNFLKMIQLYNEKIEDIHKSYSQSTKSNFGLVFWIGIVGIVSSLSAMILAWRKDNRELIKLKHELIRSDSDTQPLPD